MKRVSIIFLLLSSLLFAQFKSKGNAVKIMSAPIDTTNKTSNIYLSWDSTTQKWVMASGSAGTGDITAVNVSSPISGGGTSGAVTISADTASGSKKLATQYMLLKSITDSLARYTTAYLIDTTKINTAMFAKFVKDHQTSGGAGDIEGVTANAPITGGGISGTVAISADTSTGGSHLASQYFVTSKNYLTSETGDISSVSVNSPLSGGGNSGGVTISADTSSGGGKLATHYYVGNQGFLTSETGDISGVTATAPLSGGGTSGGVTVGADTSAGAKHLATQYHTAKSIGDSLGRYTTAFKLDTTMIDQAQWDKLVKDRQTDEAYTGDITGVTAGDLLSGGGNSGGVTINGDSSKIATQYDISLKQNIADTSTKDATRYWVQSQGYGVGGGDITSVTAGTDLTGGGIAGDVTLNADTTKLATSYDLLKSISDSLGRYTTAFKLDTTQINQAMWDKLVKDRQTDEQYLGDITGVTAGDWITGGGSTGSVTVNVDTSKAASIYDISLKQNVSDTSAKDATRYWVNQQGFGDITGINTSTGISGGASSGTPNLKADTTLLATQWYVNGSIDGLLDDVAISINDSLDRYTTNDLIDTTKLVSAQWDKMIKDRQTDELYTGDITSVNVNAPISGGGSSGSVTISADTSNGSTHLATQYYVGTHAGGSSKWTDSGSNIYRNSGVGIGVTAPATGLDIKPTTDVMPLRVRSYTLPKPALLINKQNHVLIGTSSDTVSACGTEDYGKVVISDTLADDATTGLLIDLTATPTSAWIAGMGIYNTIPSGIDGIYNYPIELYMDNYGTNTSSYGLYQNITNYGDDFVNNGWYSNVRNLASQVGHFGIQLYYSNEDTLTDDAYGNYVFMDQTTNPSHAVYLKNAHLNYSEYNIQNTAGGHAAGNFGALYEGGFHVHATDTLKKAYGYYFWNHHILGIDSLFGFYWHNPAGESPRAGNYAYYADGGNMFHSGSIGVGQKPTAQAKVIVSGGLMADTLKTPHYKLPHADGNAGEVLQTNGSGQVSFAAIGDITGVTAGDWLTGGGSSGGVTLNVDSSKVASLYDLQKSINDSLDRYTTNDLIDTTKIVQAQWDKLVKDRQTDELYTGDIEGVTASDLLTGGGTSGTVTLKVDTTKAATQYDISLKQNVSDTSAKDATRYWVGLQGYLTAETGDISNVGVNAPITGGGSSGSVTISADTSAGGAKLATHYYVGNQGYLTAEVDGIVGNEVTGGISDSSLTRSGTGTAANPYRLGIKFATAAPWTAKLGTTDSLYATLGIRTNGVFLAKGVSTFGATGTQTTIGSDGKITALKILIPSANDPATDATNNIAVDANGNGLEYYDGTASRFINDVQSYSYTLLEPDLAAAKCSLYPLYKFSTAAYPQGATIISLNIASKASITDTVTFVEQTTAAGGTTSTIEAVSCSAAETDVTSGIDDTAIAANSWVAVNIGTEFDNVETVTFTIVFRKNCGN